MAKFSFHVQCYKKENLGGIDRHNRRKNKKYGNKDIDTSRSKYNRVYISPDTTLYQACKKQIEERVLANGGRVTKASNWLCECIFSYPEELPQDRVDEYYTIILEYMANRLGPNNIVQAIKHADEGHLQHCHIDILPITDDNRLSSKRLITREFLISVHDELPKILRTHGFDIERGSADHVLAGLDAREYKKAMEKEASLIDQRINDLSNEYNKLAEAYNNLIAEKKRLEKRNIHTAYDIINHRQIIR